LRRAVSEDDFLGLANNFYIRGSFFIGGAAQVYIN
jgi:hypothetical protein